LKRFAIFDLDNCIADDSWRIKQINWAASDPDLRYHTYHLLCGFDISRNWLRIRECQRAGLGFIILTARPTSVAAITAEWLMRQDIIPHAMMMRNPGDHRHSAAIKRWQLEQLVAHYDDYGVDPSAIVRAFDDRPDVVEMYRAARDSGLVPNLEPEVLAIHDVCAYTPPASVRKMEVVR
jgi:hypothetical protein